MKKNSFLTSVNLRFQEKLNKSVLNPLPYFSKNATFLRTTTTFQKEILQRSFSSKLKLFIVKTAD